MKNTTSNEIEKPNLKQKLKTSLAFTKNFFVTGAFKETSRAVEVEICKHLPLEGGQTIVEFGMGHGNITQEILSRIAPNSKLYAFEINEDFCEYVKENMKDERLHIINDGAEQIKKYIQNPVDGIVVSIPFSFLPKEKINGLLQDVRDLMTEKASYSQVLYAKFHVKKINQFFHCHDYKRIGKFPKEYVYHYRK
ncbi:MAG: methyltransferase domain-containing protein [Bacteroidota bacterium]